MFTPEFSKSDPATYVLVANHYVETQEAADLSVAFIRARIAYGLEHVPDMTSDFVVFYDIRGQKVMPDVLQRMEDRLIEVATMKVKKE